MEEKTFVRILIVAAIVAVGVLIFANVAYGATVCNIFNGCTGTSTAPLYGQIPIGGQNGEYEFVASSTLGAGGSSSGFSTTSAAYWLTQQTTSGLAEGSNLYFTNARAVSALTGQNVSIFNNDTGYLTPSVFNTDFDARLSATTSLPNITTLAGLSLPYAQLTGTPNLSQYFTLASWYATTSAPQLTSLANLSTVGTITTGTWHGSAIGDSYISSSGNWNTAYTDRIASANYPLSIASNALSIVATSSEGCTVSCFASHNISQWTNDAGYITSLAGAASSTLLADNNTFSGNNLFSASTTVGNGTQAGGLTINGGATTTGNAFFTGAGFNSGYGTIQALMYGSNSEEGFGWNNLASGGRYYDIFSSGGSSGVGQGNLIIGDVTAGITLQKFDSSHNLWFPQLSAGLMYTNSSGEVGTTGTSSLNASITGNAGTATALQTARTINGVSFNGTANIVVSSTTLLASDNNTFSGNTTFAASTTLQKQLNAQGASTTLLSASGAVWLPGLTAGSGNGALCMTSAGLVEYNSGTNCFTSSTNVTIGNYASSTASSFSFSTSTQSFNGLTLGQNIAVSANSVLYTPNVSGTLNNSGLANSTIKLNGTTLTLGDTNDTVTAASSSILGDNNAFSGIDSFTNSSSNFSGTWQTFSPSHFQTAGTYLTTLGNYASTTGAAISLSTSTETTNGVTQGIDIVASANGLLFTPTISGTLSNAGLAHSTIILNSQTLTLGDTNDTITAASSTALGDNNTFSGNNLFTASSTFTKVVNLQNASSSLNTFGTVWLPSQSSGCATFGTGGLLTSTGSACGTSGGITALGNYATTSGTTISFSTTTETTNGVTQGIDIVASTNGVLFTPTISGTLSNAGLAHSTIVLNSQTLTLGDTNDTITAASSTLLSNNNTWSGLNSFGAATSTSFADTALTGDLVVTGSDGALENYTGTGPCAAGTFMTTLSGPGGQTCASADTFAYPWTSTSYGGTTASATSTLQGFTGGLYSTASSTINSLTSINSTSTNATSTNFSTTNASTTNLVISSLGTAAGTFLATNAQGQVIATATPSGGGGAVSSVSNSDGTLTITPTTGSVVASIALTHANSWTGLQQFTNSTSTLETVSSQLWAKDIETVLYADQFSGSDIGAQINNAYAALPSTGGTIFVPSGSYTFSTPITFGTQNKPAILQCASAVGGTTLTYSGSAATSTIINDFGTNEITYGSGIRNCSFAGSNTASTTDGGIFLGGGNGAAGTVLDSVSVTGFGYGIVTGANTYEINVNNSTFDFNYTDLSAQPANNSGERMSFTNDGFLDGRNTHFANCLYLSTSAYASATFNNSAFDDCAVVVNDGNLDTSFIGGHAENPDYEIGNQYYYFNLATTSSYGYSLTNIDDMAFENDGTTTADSPYSFILSGMHTLLSGDTFDAGNITLPSAVQMVNTSNQSLEASGIENIAGSGYTTFATSSEAFVVNQPAGTWTTSLSLASNLLLDDTAITTTDNGDEVIGTDWGWYIKGDSTHLTQIVGGSLMVGYTVGTPGGTTYPTNDVLVAGNVGLASTTPWAALTLGSGAIVVQEASTSAYTTADVNVNFQNQQTTKIEMNANTTVNLYNDAIAGEQQKVIVCQDTTGSRTLTWLSSTSLDWSGGTTPTVTATAKQCDVFSFIVTGATGTAAVFGAATQNF